MYSHLERSIFILHDPELPLGVSWAIENEYYMRIAYSEPPPMHEQSQMEESNWP